MSGKLQRRDLKFTRLNEAAHDAEALLADGYVSVGRWDLSQVCGHLTKWLSYALDGTPPLPLGLRPVFWLLRHTIGPRELGKVLAAGAMPAGVPALRRTVPPPGQDEAAAVEKLRRVVARFEAHSGPLQPSHPFFGKLDRDQWLQIQLIHCSHHLSFLRSKRAPVPDHPSA